jgi:hypothetical protein
LSDPALQGRAIMQASPMARIPIMAIFPTNLFISILPSNNSEFLSGPSRACGAPPAMPENICFTNQFILFVRIKDQVIDP